MTTRFFRNTSLLFVVLSSAVSAAVLNDGMQKGEDYYFAADFKRAISQFEFAMNANPGDPEPYLWLGKSYTLVADLKPPFLATRARLKARMYLAKAVAIAPGCEECRQELFNLLIDSDGTPSALREAQRLVANTPESDPEYPSMQLLLTEARRQSSSPESSMNAILGASWESLAGLTLSPAAVREHLHGHSRAHRFTRDSNEQALAGLDAAAALRLP